MPIHRLKDKVAGGDGKKRKTKKKQKIASGATPKPAKKRTRTA